MEVRLDRQSADCEMPGMPCQSPRLQLEWRLQAKKEPQPFFRTGVAKADQSLQLCLLHCSQHGNADAGNQGMVYLKPLLSLFQEAHRRVKRERGKEHVRGRSSDGEWLCPEPTVGLGAGPCLSLGLTFLSTLQGEIVQVQESAMSV